MTKASMVLFAAVLAGGCAGQSNRSPTHFWCGETQITRTVIETTLHQNRLLPGENIKMIPLGAAASVSHHLIQVRYGERLHIHRNHDFTVFIYRGDGMLTVGANQCPMTAGDIVFVPRGVPHKFENTGNEPAVALVAFSPALESPDSEPVTEK